MHANMQAQIIGNILGYCQKLRSGLAVNGLNWGAVPQADGGV